MDRPKKTNQNFNGSGMSRAKKLYTCANCGAKFPAEENEASPGVCPKCDNTIFY